jgi:hypothetical protein
MSRSVEFVELLSAGPRDAVSCVDLARNQVALRGISIVRYTGEIVGPGASVCSLGSNQACFVLAKIPIRGFSCGPRWGRRDWFI